MLNPLVVEQRYQNLLFILSLPSAAFHRLRAIDEFTQYVAQDGAEYDSYFLDCALKLPRIIHELRPVGQDPESLCCILERLTRSLAAGGAGSGTLLEALHELRRFVSLCYAFVGALDDSLRVLMEGEPGLGEGAEPGSTGCAALGAPANAATENAGMDIDTVGDLKRLAQRLRNQKPIIAGELDTVVARWNETSGGPAKGVEVPIVERVIGGDPRLSGSLRHVALKIFGETTGRDELRTDVAVFGVERTVTGLTDVPVKAARALLRSLEPALGGRYFVGPITFGNRQALHEGESAQLAIAAMFVCEVLHSNNRRLQYTVRSDVAITGATDGNGNVLPVDPGGMGLKLEAAFFSHVKTLVVPKVQLAEAEKHKDVLNHRFPHRRLDILGVAHLRELFHDRRVIDQRRLSVPRHLAAGIWRHRFRAAAILVIFVMGLVVIHLRLGPIDQEPAGAVFRGSVMTIQNRLGETLSQIDVGEATVNRVETEPPLLGKTHAFEDVDLDGEPDVIYAKLGPSDHKSDSVIARTIRGNRILWAKAIAHEFSFPFKGEGNTDQLVLDGLRVADIDGNGTLEVLVLANGHAAFVGAIFVLDARTGEERSIYVHPGHIIDFDIVDLNGDGIPEVVCCGGNNSFRRAFVACLNSRKVNGHGPAQEEYVPAGVPPADEDCYILLPRTVVGQLFRGSSKQNNATSITADYSHRQINVGVNDFTGPIDSSRTIWSATITFEFGFDMRVKEIIRGDVYDLLAERLAKEGLIPKKPGVAEFEQYKNDVKYWIGSKWRMGNRGLRLKELSQKMGQSPP